MTNELSLLTTKKFKPLMCFEINDSFLLGIYQGQFSKYDILIKYRQKNNNGKWSRLRTPKHIHWTVDILIKMSHYQKLTKEFIDFLVELWNKTIPNKNNKEKNISISIDEFLKNNKKGIKKFNKLNTKGEYSIKFLLSLSKLLMQQEKNNLKTAYFFKDLLDNLKRGEDIFKIIQIASHNR